MPVLVCYMLTLLIMKTEYSVLRGSILCLLMHWLLKSPVHQHTWYYLCRTDNIYCCSRVNFILMGQVKSKIRFNMWIYLLWSLKQFSVTRVNILQHSALTCSISTKPLPKTILPYYQLDPMEEISVKFESKRKTFIWQKCISKCCVQKVEHIIQ